MRYVLLGGENRGEEATRVPSAERRDIPAITYERVERDAKNYSQEATATLMIARKKFC
jgi:hypothetical protein